MSERFDVVVVGAGPAGMAAAIALREFGLSVLVVDEHAQAGGQIWRAVDRKGNDALAARLGDDYRAGATMTARLADCGATLRFSTQVWQIEDGLRLFVTHRGAASRIDASAVLLATGAQERPNPFSGWTLPGVMTVGAAQILLKTSGCIPEEPVVVAGSGPLPLLYMTQILALGGRVSAFLDTAPRANRWQAMRHLPRALGNWRALRKGLGWLRLLREADVKVVRGVRTMEAVGESALESVRYTCETGESGVLPARLLLAHEGVVPGVHATMALGCAHRWRDDQMCFAPTVDAWGETSRAGVFVAGDGGGIEGADAAILRGEIAALGIAVKLNRRSPGEVAARKAALDRKLRPILAIRPLLDALYRPRAEIFAPDDGTIACRCEEVTAGDIRKAACAGASGPNQVKTATRAGMGPCQGRQCGYTISALVAKERNVPLADTGFLNIRPPFRPVTLGELAGLSHGD